VCRSIFRQFSDQILENYPDINYKCWKNKNGYDFTFCDVIYLAIKNDCKRKQQEAEPESISAKEKVPKSTPAEKPDNILTKLCY